MTEFDFVVQSRPAPQGSKRHVGNGVMVEQSRHVKAWRDAVRVAAIDRLDQVGRRGPLFDRGTPVALRVRFWHKRPRSHFRTGRHSTELRPDAPTFVTKTPDCSKLIRSLEDAITSAGVWWDDAQVVRVRAEQLFSDTNFEGAEVTITEARP